MSVAKFAALLGNEKVLTAAEAVAKDILKKDNHVEEFASAIVEVNATVEGGIFQDADTVKEAVKLLLSVSGVKRKDQDTVAKQNAYDYRLRAVVQMVAEALDFTTEDKAFDLDKKVETFVKMIKKAVKDNEIDAADVVAALAKLEGGLEDFKTAADEKAEAVGAIAETVEQVEGGTIEG